MTEERRGMDRREEDVRLAHAVTDMNEVLDKRFVEEWRKAEAIHLDLASHSHPEIERLIEVLEGHPTVLPSGRHIYQGGLIHEVAELTQVMRNGGLKIKLPTAAWAAIVVAIITGVFNVLAVLIG